MDAAEARRLIEAFQRGLAGEKFRPVMGEMARQFGGGPAYRFGGHIYAADPFGEAFVVIEESKIIDLVDLTGPARTGASPA